MVSREKFWKGISGKYLKKKKQYYVEVRRKIYLIHTHKKKPQLNKTYIKAREWFEEEQGNVLIATEKSNNGTKRHTHVYCSTIYNSQDTISM
jgi:hypothetical protein